MVKVVSPAQFKMLEPLIHQLFMQEDFAFAPMELSGAIVQIVVSAWMEIILMAQSAYPAETLL